MGSFFMTRLVEQVETFVQVLREVEQPTFRQWTEDKAVSASRQALAIQESCKKASDRAQIARADELLQSTPLFRDITCSTLSTHAPQLLFERMARSVFLGPAVVPFLLQQASPVIKKCLQNRCTQNGTIFLLQKSLCSLGVDNRNLDNAPQRARASLIRQKWVSALDNERDSMKNLLIRHVQQQALLLETVMYLLLPREFEYASWSTTWKEISPVLGDWVLSLCQSLAEREDLLYTVPWLERQWWFSLPLSVLLLVLDNFSQFVDYFLLLLSPTLADL